MVTKRSWPGRRGVSKAATGAGVRACGFMDNPARPDSVLTAARFPGDRAMDNRAAVAHTLPTGRPLPTSPTSRNYYFL